MLRAPIGQCDQRLDQRCSRAASGRIRPAAGSSGRRCGVDQAVALEAAHGQRQHALRDAADRSRRSSLKRTGPFDRRPTTKTVHLSPSRESTSPSARQSSPCVNRLSDASCPYGKDCDHAAMLRPASVVQTQSGYGCAVEIGEGGNAEGPAAWTCASRLPEGPLNRTAFLPRSRRPSGSSQADASHVRRSAAMALTQKDVLMRHGREIGMHRAHPWPIPAFEPRLIRST